MVLTDNIFEGEWKLTFLLLLFLFLVGCLLGYGIEVLFRRFFTAKKWVNPGFMKGPWLPLYGFGLVLMFSLSGLFYEHLPESILLYNPNGDLFGKTIACGPQVGDLIPIVTIGLGMTLLEFIAGIIFVKGFKVRLWDYSNMRGNILGVICPVFSMIWFAVSVLYYYAINPYVYTATESAYLYMFGETVGGDAAHFLFIFLMGVTFGVMMVDFITSANLFAKLSKMARNSQLVVRYEQLKEENKKSREEAKAKFFESIPDSVKKMISPSQKHLENANAFRRAIRKIVLIDPDKEKSTDQNYDENGRPIKEEESEN